MEVLKKFNITLEKKELITIVGGGGKTTTLFNLAKKLKKNNKRVLITTTTAIYIPNKNQYDHIVIGNDLNNIPSYKGEITLIGRGISKENKLLGIDKYAVDKIYNNNVFDYIIVEGDGSKGRPIKAPGSHEPVIPLESTVVIGLVGLDCLGERIDEEYVHRPNIFSYITDSKIGDIINGDHIYRLVIHKNGLFKSSPSTSKRYFLLNKANNYEKVKCGINIRKKLFSSSFNIDGVLIGEIIKDEVF